MSAQAGEATGAPAGDEAPEPAEQPAAAEVAGRRFERVVLVGTGLIGGSLLLALRRAGLVAHAVGVEVDPERARIARERRIVDETAPAPAGPAALAGADLVVLGTPVGATAAVVAELGPHLAPDCLLLDVGSTKRGVVEAVERALPHPGRFVGCHPIAGTERSGPCAADPDLFAGRPVILTPTAATLPGALDAARALWTVAGARVAIMDPALHDEVLAVTSHLPHAAAFALAATVERVLGRDDQLAAAAAGLYGAGFFDTTRVAGSDPIMWRDIFLANRPAVVALVDVLHDEVGHLREALRKADGPALLDLVMRARRGRTRVLATPHK